MLSRNLRKGISQPGEMKIECAKDRSICVVNQPVKYDGADMNLVVCCQITNGVANLFEQALNTEEVSIEDCLNSQK